MQIYVLFDDGVMRVWEEIDRAVVLCLTIRDDKKCDSNVGIIQSPDYPVFRFAARQQGCLGCLLVRGWLVRAGRHKFQKLRTASVMPRRISTQ